MSTTNDATPSTLLNADRLKAFTDGVTAIALTLLILPLMESVAEIAAEGHGAAEFLDAKGGQLFSFIMSFVLIALFWTSQHRVFDRVEHTTGPLVWLAIAWMFVIVWLPVATAMLGSMRLDAVLALLYIGSLVLISAITLATRLYLRAHPQLHTIEAQSLARGVQVETVMLVLLALALILTLVVPSIGMLSMFLLMLTIPITVFLARRQPKR